MTDDEMDARLLALSDADVRELAGEAGGPGTIAWHRPLASRQALAREVERLRAALLAERELHLVANRSLLGERDTLRSALRNLLRAWDEQEKHGVRLVTSPATLAAVSVARALVGEGE